MMRAVRVVVGYLIELRVLVVWLIAAIVIDQSKVLHGDVESPQVLALFAAMPIAFACGILDFYWADVKKATDKGRKWPWERGK